MSIKCDSCGKFIGYRKEAFGPFAVKAPETICGKPVCQKCWNKYVKMARELE